MKNEIREYLETCLQQALDKFDGSTLRIAEELVEMAARSAAWIDYASGNESLFDLFDTRYTSVEEIAPERGLSIILNELKNRGIFDA